jgi:hypothetical protein
MEKLRYNICRLFNKHVGVHFRILYYVDFSIGFDYIQFSIYSKSNIVITKEDYKKIDTEKLIIILQTAIKSALKYNDTIFYVDNTIILKCYNNLVWDGSFSINTHTKEYHTIFPMDL